MKMKMLGVRTLFDTCGTQLKRSKGSTCEMGEEKCQAKEQLADAQYKKTEFLQII